MMASGARAVGGSVCCMGCMGCMGTAVGDLQGAAVKYTIIIMIYEAMENLSFSCIHGDHL